MNYYEILEISKNSNTQSIKKHYYALSKKYHPDKNKEKDASEKFKTSLFLFAISLILKVDTFYISRFDLLRF